MVMSQTILRTIHALLTAEGVAFCEVHHEPTYTSEESAQARGEELRTGGKALVLRGENAFALFVLPADRKIDSGAVRRTLGWRKLRFASREELFAATGLVPGSVPPFGQPVLPFPLYVDSGITENERIAFNAGSLTDSIILSVADYLRVARPAAIFGFSSADNPADKKGVSPS
jgi:Ala-tRNA(Pro) deacylase